MLFIHPHLPELDDDVQVVGLHLAGGIVRGHLFRRFENCQSLLVLKAIDPDAVFITAEGVKIGVSNIGEALQNVGKTIEKNIQQPNQIKNNEYPMF